MVKISHLLIVGALFLVSFKQCVFYKQKNINFYIKLCKHEQNIFTKNNLQLTFITNNEFINTLLFCDHSKIKIE